MRKKKKEEKVKNKKDCANSNINLCRNSTVETKGIKDTQIHMCTHTNQWWIQTIYIYNGITKGILKILEIPNSQTHIY